MEKWKIGFWDNGILIRGKIRVGGIIKYSHLTPDERQPASFCQPLNDEKGESNQHGLSP
jgi:hypothetical protein